MRGRVLLNLLKELWKSDKMRCLPSMLSSFCNKLYKFNKTRARMLDSINHMSLTLIVIAFLMGKRKYFAILPYIRVRSVAMGAILYRYQNL